ncbi:leucine-rich repeat domain-containing protein [uncultured Parvimonas sp.]|uniref:leucine-rich repeat domain-containing protein n=1 Tax=uncultured Parvimonas sp. TaxID=747372 RepID=UPI002592F982|nr:leucine-rich repeat domain-containing protein [uncultured Parvimonas sp.]
MKNKSVLALALLCGFSFSQNISYADGETVIYNKDGIVLKLSGDDKGTFKVSIENNSSKDMFGVKLKSEDIKGLKIVSGKEIEIGNVKAGEKRVLDEKELKFEIEKAIQYSIKKDKLSKTGVDGVYKIYIPIAIAGMVGAICVLVSKKRNAKRLLSVAIGTGILASSILTYTTNADVIYKNSVDVRGKININDEFYDYVGVLMWNDVESGKINEKDNTKPDINPNKPDTKPDTKPDEPSVPNNPEEKDKVVEIEDANLKKFILDKLHAYNGEDSFEAEMKEYNFKLTDKSYRKDKNSNDIYKSDLEKIEALGIRGMDASEENLIEVSSIKGLEFCKNLKSLTISSGEIPDDYEEIRYSEGAIKDLTPLSALKNLEFLRLSHNEISDVSPLKDLTNLKSLYISHNNISDISALENLKNLENFDFAVNKVSDMSIVKNFTKLKLLDIYSNKISNIDAVKDLEKLLYFRADSNKIENIDALKNLKLLEDLDLGNNKLKDTSVLNGLINLKKLSLKGNNIENLNLNKLINLDDLNLENNKISDISFLKNSTKLANLNLKKNNIENIDNVSGLTKLTYLNLSDNLISNVEPLKSLTKLSSLYLSNNKISDISALKNLNELSSIKLDGNKIKDFSLINDKKSIFEKIIHNQNVDLGNVEVREKTFEIDNVFVGLEKIAKGGNIKVSTEAEGVTVTLESGKLKLNLTDKVTENIKEGLKLTVKFKFENEMDYENNPTVLNLNLNLVKPAKKYVEIEDAKLLKVINKNLDKNRADNQKVTVEEMESLTELSIFLKEDGSADFSENAKYSILGKPTSLKGTKDFKFAVTRGMKNIKGLEYAKNLKKLKLNENEISDITPLKDLTKLEYLEIQRNRIVDIKPLEKLTNLTFLKLYNNLIEDITPLSNLTNLTGLDLHYNVTVGGDESHKIISKGITDISALKNLKNLTFLDISANRIEDVSILKDLNKIEHLDISGNRIKELGVALGEVFGAEEALNPFSEISTGKDGIDASYDLDSNTITLNISDDVIAENKGKELNLNLKMLLDEYTWTLKNVKLKFSE